MRIEVEVAGQTWEGMVTSYRSSGRVVGQSVADPIISYIVGPCTCAETMALNGYINIFRLWQECSNWSPIYSLV